MIKAGLVFCFFSLVYCNSDHATQPCRFLSLEPWILVGEYGWATEWFVK